MTLEEDINRIRSYIKHELKSAHIFFERNHSILCKAQQMIVNLENQETLNLVSKVYVGAREKRIMLTRSCYFYELMLFLIDSIDNTQSDTLLFLKAIRKMFARLDCEYRNNTIGYDIGSDYFWRMITEYGTEWIIKAIEEKDFKFLIEIARIMKNYFFESVVNLNKKYQEDPVFDWFGNGISSIYREVEDFFNVLKNNLGDE